MLRGRGAAWLLRHVWLASALARSPLPCLETDPLCPRSASARPLLTGCNVSDIPATSTGQSLCQSGVWKSPGNYLGQYVVRFYNGSNVVPDGTGCQANPFTGACSCPAGSRDYAYMTGQSYYTSPWDGSWWTHFCFS